jgi:hypothetical protein
MYFLLTFSYYFIIFRIVWEHYVDRYFAPPARSTTLPAPFREGAFVCIQNL